MVEHRITKHAQTRCQQRGIPEECIQLITAYGTSTPYGYYLRRKDVQAFERDMKKQIETLYKVAGVLVPVEDGKALSAYRVNDPKKHRHCNENVKGCA